MPFKKIWIFRWLTLYLACRRKILGWFWHHVHFLQFSALPHKCSTFCVEPQINHFLHHDIRQLFEKHREEELWCHLLVTKAHKCFFWPLKLSCKSQTSECILLFFSRIRQFVPRNSEKFTIVYYFCKETRYEMQGIQLNARCRFNNSHATQNKSLS